MYLIPLRCDIKMLDRLMIPFTRKNLIDEGTFIKRRTVIEFQKGCLRHI